MNRASNSFHLSLRESASEQRYNSGLRSGRCGSNRINSGRFDVSSTLFTERWRGALTCPNGCASDLPRPNHSSLPIRAFNTVPDLITSNGMIASLPSCNIILSILPTCRTKARHFALMDAGSSFPYQYLAVKCNLPTNVHSVGIRLHTRLLLSHRSYPDQCNQGIGTVLVASCAHCCHRMQM